MPSARVDIEIEGVPELQAKLTALQSHVRNALQWQALSKAAELLVPAIKANTPVGKTGHLRESIDIQEWGRKSGKFGAVFVGPTYPGGQVGHLVEFGTGDRYTKSGKYTGRMPAKPFVGPAVKANADRVQQILADELGQGIEEFAAK